MTNTLQQPEKIEIPNDWQDQPRLQKTYYARLQKKISDFTAEDLRFMIGQGAGLGHLVPAAHGLLKKNILVEGDMYPGDLMSRVLNIESNFWEKHPDLKKKTKTLFQKQSKELLAYQDNESVPAAIRESFDASSFDDLMANIRDAIQELSREYEQFG